jgi:hypothetical protein
MAPPISAPIAMPGSPDDDIPPAAAFPPIQRPAVPGQPGNMPPGAGGNVPNQPPPSSQPAAPTFGPIAPTAPGAGRIGGQPPANQPAPPPPPPPAFGIPNFPGPGRGGNLP